MTTTQSIVLAFDGKDDFISLPAMNVDYSKGITVEAWVFYNSFKHWSRVIDFSNGVGQDNLVFANYGSTNGLAISIRQGGNEQQLIASGVLETGKWLHLAMTVDAAGNGKLYKNGQEIKSGKMHLPLSINRTLNYIGKSPWPNDGYFDGYMTDVRVWNIARSPAEIMKDMVCLGFAMGEASLVGYWPLNDGSGNTASDKSGKGNHGTISGGATWQQQQLPVQVTQTQTTTQTTFQVITYLTDKAYLLNGTSDFLQIDSNDAINFGTNENFTISVWVQADAQQKDTRNGDNDVVEKWSSSGSYPYVIRYVNQTNAANGAISAGRYDGKNNPFIVSKTKISDGKFHHVVFARTTENGKGKLYLYVDGKLEGTTDDTTTGDTKNNSPLFIGQRGGNPGINFFCGSVKELCFFKSSLSVEQIQQISTGVSITSLIEKWSTTVVTMTPSETLIVGPGGIYRPQEPTVVPTPPIVGPGGIYRPSAGNQPIQGQWQQISGGLKQISVGSNQLVWGVSSNDQIWRYLWNNNWENIPGGLKNVSVAADGTVFGVNANDDIFQYANGKWTQINGKLKQISVGSAQHVWGVNSSDAIYRYLGNGQWENIPGNLKNVSVAADGTVFGVNSIDDIYQYLGGGKWVQINGKLKQISVGSAQHVWGVNSSDQIWHYLGDNKWEQIAGGLKWVSVAADGTVFGVNSNDQIWRFIYAESKAVTPTGNRPVVYYPLNGNAQDASGNNVHGAEKGKITYAAGRIDQAGVFDGGSYIEVDDPFKDTTQFTIALWLKPTAMNDGGFHGFIGKQGDAYRKPGMWVSPANSGLHYDSYSTTGQRFADILNNFFEAKDRWVHVTWVKQGTEYRIYRNGELFATRPAPENFYTAKSSYWIGRIDNFFVGQIDDVRIYNVPLSVDKIKALINSNLNMGLIAHYPSEGNANDVSGNNLHGTVHGATLAVDRFGNPNCAYNFNGKGDKIIVNENPLLNLGTGNFAIMAWIKTSQTGIWKRIITKRAGNNPNWYSLAVLNGKAVFEIYPSGNLLSTSNVNDGAWHFVCVVRGSQTFSMYIDGALQSTMPDTGLNLNSPGSNLEIGIWANESYDTGTFTGNIDDIRIYNRALSAEEIKQIHQLVSKSVSAKGKIVVNADEWTLGNAGFQNAPDTATFVTNVAKWFVGNRAGKFHAFSANFGLVESSLADTIKKAGHTWTIGTNIKFDLPTLLTYDGIFLSGDAADNQVLIDYVNAGGNVYLCAGTGAGGAQAEADRWNKFLGAFGLKFLGQYNGISGNQAINSTHPIFAGVKALYQNNGNSIVDLEPSNPANQIVLSHANGQGLIAVY